MVNLDSAIESISNSLRIHYKHIEALESFPSSMISGMANLQASIAMASSLYDSFMIDNVARYIASLNLDGCVTSIQETIDKPQVIMPDYSFIKTSPLIKSIHKEIVFPRGFPTNIKNFNFTSARQIANNKEIVYSNENRAFVSGECIVSVQEINAICSAVRFLKTIDDAELFSEDELIDFMSFLDQTPKLAMDNPTGRKICQVIQRITEWIQFDKDVFYHSRPRKKTDAPYVWAQMLKAPYGVSSVGRYNEAGQGRFYFADAEVGSVNEIRKHVGKECNDDYIIQTVMISAQNPVKILDLSAKEMRGLNTFLRFIRMPLSTVSGSRPREYLIPQFIADCCMACGLDGIKYYGGKDYSNYVTWKDGYYSYVRNVGDSSILEK